MTAPKRILVVEDDPSIASSVVRSLRAAGYEVELCGDGAAAIDKATTSPFAAVVLDLMLPSASGFEVLAACRARVASPIVVLSAKTELSARLQSFELGAVDYISKPFFMEELLARLRLRLGETALAPPRREVAWADAVLDLDARTVRVGQQVVALTPSELSVLAHLAERPGRAVSRASIADAALSASGDVSDRTVDSHVARLRNKLGESAAKAIATVWGIGYRFQPRDGGNA
ncbi:MAG: response regulator transcription factor [Myxococcota bacterium]